MVKKILGWTVGIAVLVWALNHQAHAGHVITQAGDLLGTLANSVGSLVSKAGL
jgi:hypothetical protein